MSDAVNPNPTGQTGQAPNNTSEAAGVLSPPVGPLSKLAAQSDSRDKVVELCIGTSAVLEAIDECIVAGDIEKARKMLAGEVDNMSKMAVGLCYISDLTRDEATVVIEYIIAKLFKPDVKIPSQPHKNSSATG